MAATDQPKKSAKIIWRTCMLCSTRLSELCYDTHTLCEACRGQVCSSDSFCKECENWSADFCKLYLRHKNSLLAKRVSKKNRKEGKSKDKSPLNLLSVTPGVRGRFRTVTTSGRLGRFSSITFFSFFFFSGHYTDDSFYAIICLFLRFYYVLVVNC